MYAYHQELNKILNDLLFHLLSNFKSYKPIPTPYPIALSNSRFELTEKGYFLGDFILTGESLEILGFIVCFGCLFYGNLSILLMKGGKAV